jgi:hypothetical protein
MADLLWFAHGRTIQCDPSLYYPPVPVFEAVKKAGPGRIIGYGCLPATLSVMCDLWDIRGHDAVEPARMVDLITLATEGAATMPRHAVTMQVAPKAIITSAGDIRIAPVLDMLGVRYVIMRGSPPTNAVPVFKGPDYWALKNPAAMERVYIPRRVEWITNDVERLQKMGSPGFNPREVAFVETALELPSSCMGTASIAEETPTRIRVNTQMKTPGLLVLADRWDKGWRGYLDGKSVAISPVNHAIRGVIVPEGVHNLEFRYQPASFILGLQMAGLAGMIVLGWLGMALIRRKPYSV